MAGRIFTELTGAFNFNRSGASRKATETAQGGLTYLLQADASVDRVRLLASLAQAHSLPARYQPAHGALLEVLNLASQLSDQSLRPDYLLLGRW